MLRFEDPGREPSLDLPLGGAAPEVEADSATEIDETMAVGIPGIEMQWTIDTLLTGRDWPLPIGFKGGTRVAGARAETGHQWVGIVARVDVDECDCKGGVLDQARSARLIVDGTPFTAAADESSKPIMTTSTFSDVMLVFDIPAEASDARAAGRSARGAGSTGHPEPRSGLNVTVGAVGTWQWTDVQTRRARADGLATPRNDDPGVSSGLMPVTANLPMSSAIDDASPAFPAAPPRPQGGVLVGRDADLARLSVALSSPDARIVTLAGPGGSGKSRLAAEAAARSLPEFGGRVAWIDLASIQAVDQVESEVVSGIGLGDVAADRLPDELAAALGGAPTLLILDDAEHVIDGVRCGGRPSGLDPRRCACS